MKQFLKIFVLCVPAVLSGGWHLSYAHDFSEKMKSGNILYYNIIDTVKRTVEVTFEGKYNRPDRISVSGVLIIPEQVVYNKKKYSVVKVGDKAFSGAEKIESVIFPSTVKVIGDFAFENCISLASVVFPGRQTLVGDGAFWGCSMIKDVRYGSDWTSVDLGMFRWSENLEAVFVPAKVKKLSNLRQIKSLGRIIVDDNNPAFSSVDGILYSKNKATLYNCPVARSNDVVVPEGVKSILRGAFLECSEIRSVDLPTSLTSISFLDFSDMTSLESLTIRTDKPLMTAKYEGNAVFALKLAPSVKLFVKKDAYDGYLSSLCSSTGNYESMDGKDKASYSGTEFLQKNNVKKISK